MQPDQPDPLMDLIRRYGAFRVNNEVVPNDRNAAKVREAAKAIVAALDADRAAAYQRGLAEGRSLLYADGFSDGCEAAADAIRTADTSGWPGGRQGEVDACQGIAAKIAEEAKSRD